MALIIERSRLFAENAHGDQVRKYTGHPYTEHTKAVATQIAMVGFSSDVIAAAHLHDVLEDTPITKAELQKEFGPVVTKLVLEVTDVSKPSDGNRATRKEIDRKHLAKASPEGQSIKVADIINNTRSIAEHDPEFAKVYLVEMEALLAVLTQANPHLLKIARKQLNVLSRSLHS